jgi:hypothetical protein
LTPTFLLQNMDFLSGMPPPQRTRLRRLMVGLVLATDMQQHAALTQRFTSLVQQAAGGGAGAAEVGAPVLLQEQHELVLQVCVEGGRGPAAPCGCCDVLLASTWGQHLGPALITHV